MKPGKHKKLSIHQLYFLFLQIQLEIINVKFLTSEMEDVAKELTISSLRGSQVNVNFEDFQGTSPKSHPFPVFIRKTTPSLLSNSSTDICKVCYCLK